MSNRLPGPLTPLQVARRYGFPEDRAGVGQSIAVVSLGGALDTREVRDSLLRLGVEVPQIRVVDVDKASISPQQDALPTHETHLDLETLGALCPSAALTVYRAPNPYGMAAALSAAVDDDNGIVSISWGAPEPFDGNDPAMERVMTDMEPVLTKAREAQITVCVAAGDGGSGDMRTADGAIPAPDGLAHVGYPASSPQVLSCGGTQFDPANGDAVEVVWNEASSGGGATGGGVSRRFALPDWQARAGVHIPSADSGRIGRVLPDVAGLASDRGWQIVERGHREVTGGTSAVAPLWAAFLTMANEARALAGRPRLGFLNERLYSLAAEGGGGVLRPITEGHNRCNPDYPGYEAGEGFDACTGWGVPIGAALFDALVQME